jgi:hypothetical protein
MLLAECNYTIYNKELIAIIKAFKEWRLELAKTKDSIKVISNYTILLLDIISLLVGRLETAYLTMWWISASADLG